MNFINNNLFWDVSYFGFGLIFEIIVVFTLNFFTLTVQFFRVMKFYNRLSMVCIVKIIFLF